MQRPSVMKPILILASAVILLAGIHFAASIVTPVLLAIFFAVLLSPIYSWLKKKLPAGLALLLTLVFLLLLVLFLLWLVGNSVTALATSLASYNEQISQRQAELQASAGILAQSGAFKAAISALDPAVLTGALSFVLGALAGIFKQGLLILFVTLFALTEGPQFGVRLVKAFGPDHFVVRNSMGLVKMVISYFGLRAIVNLFTAVGTGLMLWLFGIPYAGLWAVLIFFLSFIPYIGAFLATIPPLLLAYAQGGLGLVVVIGILSVVINGLAENIVSPFVMGKGLSVSPTVVFISYLFWMFILGGAGALIAMPLTVALILFMGSFEETRAIADVMGTMPAPKAEPEPVSVPEPAGKA
jgi:AI-2 transport protein TqsA